MTIQKRFGDLTAKPWKVATVYDKETLFNVFNDGAGTPICSKFLDY